MRTVGGDNKRTMRATVQTAAHGARLDKFLAGLGLDWMPSHRAATRAVEAGLVAVNGGVQPQPSWRVDSGDVVRCCPQAVQRLADARAATHAARQREQHRAGRRRRPFEPIILHDDPNVSVVQVQRGWGPQAVRLQLEAMCGADGALARWACVRVRLHAPSDLRAAPPCRTVAERSCPSTMPRIRAWCATPSTARRPRSCGVPSGSGFAPLSRAASPSGRLVRCAGAWSTARAAAMAAAPATRGFGAPTATPWEPSAWSS